MHSNTPNITIARATIGTLLGFIGIASLVFAAITFAWYLTFNLVIILALVIGLFGFVAWAVIAPKTFINTLTGKQARYSTGATLASVLLFGIITLIYIFVQRANIGFDATIGSTFSLSNTSFRVIDRIPEGQHVQITGFYSADGLPQRELDDQFLRQYQLETEGKIIVRYIDPIEQPAIAQRFGVIDDGNIFLSFVDAEGNIDFDSITFVPRQGKQERDLTSALQRMVNSQALKVYFDESRGNLSVFAETGQGLTLFENNLLFNGVQTDTLDLREITLANQIIPDDAAVLIMARPLGELHEDEVSVIDEYLNRGGALLILTDILFNENPFLGEKTSFSNYLLKNYGLRALDATIIETPNLSVQTPLDIISYGIFTEHPIGQNLPQQDILFHIARAVEAVPEKPETVANGRIIFSSPDSYGERDLVKLSETNVFEFDSQQDIAGPLDIVVWAWDEQGDGSKIVMVGDGDFATNDLLMSGTDGNAALLVESINWLAGFNERIEFGFSADPSAIPTIFISSSQLDIIGMITIVIIPLVVLLTGIAVWYRRTFA